MAQNRKPDTDGTPEAGPLVPLYSSTGIAPGIQAYRRGDTILYTVRGEPAEVQELIGQLDKKGVGEVIALITHSAEPPVLDVGEPEDDETAGD